MMEFDRFFKLCCNYILSAIKDKISGVQDKAYAFYWVCTPITHHCSTSICTHYLLASSITSISPLLLDFITKGTSSPTHSPTLPHSVSLSVSLALYLSLSHTVSLALYLSRTLSHALSLIHFYRVSFLSPTPHSSLHQGAILQSLGSVQLLPLSHY